MLDGRVKSLHPMIHAGILADREKELHMEEVIAHKIKLIGLVVVNLYPFKETVQKSPNNHNKIIENIDIGGPTLIRAAAKNYKYVTVVVDPNDYDMIIKYLKDEGEVPLEVRERLAFKAFMMTFKYDEDIDNYFRNKIGKGELLSLDYEKLYSLRYGENPHQKAVFFKNPLNDQPNVTNAKILNGKKLSYNNIIDTDAALELVKDFMKVPTVAIIKHANPAGVASDKTIEGAFKKAHQADPISAFGCVIALTRVCNEKIVDYINENKMFIEIIICPKFEPKALKKLMKRKNLRLLETGRLFRDSEKIDVKKVAGGILVQHADTRKITKKDLKVVTKKKPTKQQLEDMLFARNVVKHVKSNSVCFANKLVTTGIGSGQTSRVDAVKIATIKGGKRISGSVLASDAFFPFPDGVEEAHKAGVKAVIQPGGSIRDEEVIKRANELGLAMVFTGIRCFRH
jgi:phosphoribosylaminoimidazolecarboxamide formyltransferase/IMP cyclohydrolase